MTDDKPVADGAPALRGGRLRSRRPRRDTADEALVGHARHAAQDVIRLYSIGCLIEGAARGTECVIRAVLLAPPETATVVARGADEREACLNLLELASNWSRVRSSRQWASRPPY